jgi:hypothetical protein
MTRISQLRLKITASAITIISLLLIQARPACAREDSEPGQTNVSPAVESVSDTLAFINWTTQNPGGTILHYAVVHYGKDPRHLDLKAESPTRINPSHSEMVFRVRMGDLEPGTTYYYKVSSRQATGILDPATSTVHKFTTRPAHWMNANK